MQLLCKNEDKLLAMMSDEEKEIFEKHQDCQGDISQYNNANAFVAGFRMGARLFMESFCGDDGLFESILS